MTSAYLVALIAVAYFSRATARRIVGALAGGAVGGCVGMASIALAESRGWALLPGVRTPSLIALQYVGCSISLAPVYLVTWRIARRFGARGLALCIVAAAVIGPPRDYRFAATFPQWMVFGPGVAPVLAVAATYVLWVALGHAVMRLVAGPASADRLRGRA